MRRRKVRFLPLYFFLPLLRNREVAQRILSSGRPLSPEEKEYLEDVVRQGERAERILRRAGYFEAGPRGELLRKYGILTESDEEALEILKTLGSD